MNLQYHTRRACILARHQATGHSAQGGIGRSPVQLHCACRCTLQSLGRNHRWTEFLLCHTGTLQTETLSVNLKEGGRAKSGQSCEKSVWVHSPWQPSGLSSVKFQNPFRHLSHLCPPTYVLQWHCPATVPSSSSVLPSHIPSSTVPSGSQSQAGKQNNVSERLVTSAFTYLRLQISGSLISRAGSS